MFISEFQNLLQIFNSLGLTIDKLLPSVVTSTVLYILLCRRFDKRFDKLEKAIDQLREKVLVLEHAVVEIQSILSNVLKVNINYPIQKR